MRKAIGLLLFITSFVFGYTLTVAFELMTLADNPDVEAVTEMPILTTACRLMIEDDDLFVGQTISFPATVYALNTGELIAHPLDLEWCDNYSKLRWLPLPAQLEIDPNGQMAELGDYLQRNKLEVDLQIIGPARIHLVDGKYKIYLVNPTEVRRLSPFRTFTPKGAA